MKIRISLDKENEFFILKLEDNGKGYEQNKEFDSIGLIIIKTLVKNQLKGNIKIESKNRVEIEISWEKKRSKNKKRELINNDMKNYIINPI